MLTNSPKRPTLKNIVQIIALFLFLSPCLALAQAEDKVYKNALEAFYEEDFNDGIVLFNEVLELKPKYKDAEYRLELCSLLLKENRERPLDNILAYVNKKGTKDKFYHYWMGRVYANRYMFPEAVTAWKKFLGQKAYKSKEIVEETRDFLKETKKNLEYFDNTDSYEVHQLEAPVNTKFAEMSPVYFEEKQELLYASAHNSRGDVFEIYHSIRKDYNWTEPSKLTSLGRFDRSSANIEVVNEDGKLFLFKKNSLYFSEPTDSGWKVPEEFDSKISSKNLASHFYINTHEDRIIFVSKHKHDGLDLHETFKDPNSGKWSKPTPLPGVINSSFDEESPYLSPDEKTLYFSSKRPGGVGGFDVYISRFDDRNKVWMEAENMGWPVNSPDDDIHFKMNDDQKSGYFVSNRIYSKGDYDIFFFWEIEKAFIEGRVINSLTDEVITDGEIRFHPSQYLIEYFRSPIDENGRFRTEIISDEKFEVEIIDGLDTLGTDTYEVHDSKGETITHVQDFYVIKKGASAEELAIHREKSNKDKSPALIPEEKSVAIVESEKAPIKVDKPIVEEAQKQDVESFTSKYRTSDRMVLQNIYFDFGTAQLTKESDDMLERLYNSLKASPKLKIEIGGHTDNIGKAEVNQWISENRAKAVKKWLEKKGIENGRIVAKGYGESKPLASNDDEINGRELNRRIEIMVIE